MNQQELIWVRLPFSSLKESKVRPAVVVSNNEYNRRRNVIVCAITSRLEEKQYSILIDSDSLSHGTLPIKSRIRADKIMQIDKSLIIKSFAKLDNKTFDSLIGEIMKLVQRGK